MLLSIYEVKPGMELEQAVVSPETGKILLNSGVILSIKNIEKIKEHKIEELHIADRYSVFVSPDDKIAESIVKDFISYLRLLCPKRPEANMNDHVVTVAKHLETLIMKVSRVPDIMPFLVELKLTDNLRLYTHSIYTAVLSGVIAGCMNMSPKDILTTIIGALLHNIGMCEMPLLIGQENLTGQREALYK